MRTSLLPLDGEAVNLLTVVMSFPNKYSHRRLRWVSDEIDHPPADGKPHNTADPTASLAGRGLRDE